ncbi:hypothetical protein AGMMS50239_25970 [Bacteroidia bacterium]|nr:hypothetical protein AGMMS50239_25970 [Bacteroidia bacterium]
MAFGKDIYEISYLNNELTVPKLIPHEHIIFSKISFISETRNIIAQWMENRNALSKGMSIGFYFGEVFSDFMLAKDEIDELPLDFLNVKFSVRKTNSGIKYYISSINDEFETDYKNSSSGIQNTVPVALITKYFSEKFSFENAFDRAVIQYVLRTGNLSTKSKLVYIIIFV